METMYQAGVSEKLIQQRTGHRSLDALRKHERTSDVQLLDVCNVISGNRPTGSDAVSTNAIEYKCCAATSTISTALSNNRFYWLATLQDVLSTSVLSQV